MYRRFVIKPKSDYYISAFRIFLCTFLFDGYLTFYIILLTPGYNFHSAFLTGLVNLRHCRSRNSILAFVI
jgi:hypothetical protein